jgi:hypothetical protein
VLFPPPPPHPGPRTIKLSSVRTYSAKRLRPVPLIQTNEKSENPARPSQRSNAKRPGDFSAAAGAAVVATEMVEEVVVRIPLALIDAGLNEHVAPAGRPEHDSEMVPLNPVEEATDIVVVPVAPGAVTDIVDWKVPIDAKNPGVMVKVTGAVVLLALKLGSPE